MSTTPLQERRAKEALLAAAHPADGVPAQAVYAEARECSHCNHVGLNDSADDIATCNECQWSGDSPKEDKCPDCQAEGTMTASCPKCHHGYRLLADATLAATQPAAQGMDALKNLAEVIVGMSVSIDVSTNDHDTFDRYFGTVTEVQEDLGRKNGLMLLVQEPKPNFTPTALTQAARSVLAERARQISAEGWTPEADDSYNPGVLALHGGLYACHAYDNLTKKRAPEGWLWDEKWWKPKDPRSTLVKAGALVLAEIERIDRTYAAQAKQGGA